MSKLRPECGNGSHKPTVPDKDMWFLVRAAVAKRRSLAHGALHRGGNSCAMGCFWEDNPNLAAWDHMTDAVAAVNDANPKETPHQRWKRVNAWLKWKLSTL
jgi:hypothetical protein